MLDDIFDPNLGPSPYGILWNTPGDRSYFTGVDRGVLYIGESGYPWHGLTSVDETPTGGEIRPFYIDGIRRRNDHATEEFEAKISAYTYPEAFNACQGEVRLAPGLYLGQQSRESFGFSYRNFVGNDLGGYEADYQLNIVYDAMANPTSRTHTTRTQDSTPEPLTWAIETVPIDVSGHRPTSRIRLDSREIPKDRLWLIEEILYGTPDILPRMPTIDEINVILTEPDPVSEEEEIPWEPEEPEEETG